MEQALVLIQGIGEPKPMETLRRVVLAILPATYVGQEQYGASRIGCRSCSICAG
jgi:hypothetical protein